MSSALMGTARGTWTSPRYMKNKWITAGLQIEKMDEVQGMFLNAIRKAWGS